ncbi:hypothetical protein KMP13_14820 [Epibacterium ulvae]|uniref:hypothetical protein n=1 Tax=Epibacterium ulvae TaxID=1156985 RepID=UPI001BFC2A1D|nr:hypothetical protein [Epibacterium ulvae]MBT8155121.1 hypothetical protein [Epibacterium ulvae]
MQRRFHTHQHALLTAGITKLEPLQAQSDKQDELVPLLRAGRDPAAGFDGLLGAELARDILLSHEGLTNYLYDFQSATLEAFRARTETFETTIVLLTRHPEDWLRSYYRQAVLNPANRASDL